MNRPYYAVTSKTLYLTLRKGASGKPRATSAHKVLVVTWYYDTGSLHDEKPEGQATFRFWFILILVKKV